MSGSERLVQVPYRSCA